MQMAGVEDNPCRNPRLKQSGKAEAARQRQSVLRSSTCLSSAFPGAVQLV